jgi:hypothetical protein
VTFLDPSKDATLEKPEFLDKMADNLQLPSAQGGDIGLFSEWTDYLEREKKYASERFGLYKGLERYAIDDALDFLWRGGKENNPNAALTIFRHFDSASVGHGFIGDYPETAWVIDYPLFERIHYLLVAGFNVFDNLKHQLNTRLYMDFLRIEAEDTFLSFLPASHRMAIRDGWYEGMRDGMNANLHDLDYWMSRDLVSGYKSNDPQHELYQHMERWFDSVIKKDDVLNRCEEAPCHANNSGFDKRRVNAALRKITATKGSTLAAFPDVAMVKVVRGGKPKDDFAYSIIRNKAYKNVSYFFQNEEDSELRDYSHDSLTVIDWIEGSYPNFFFVVSIEDIEKFSKRYSELKTREAYEGFVAIYGIRRTNQQFWGVADWFQAKYLQEKPIQAGLLDLNRYHNR